MNRLCGIYKITSPSGKIYIGQSVNIHARFKSYKNKKITNNQTKLERSFKKYGHKNHVLEVIELCDKSKLNEREIFYIKKFNSFESEHGLNLKAGGHNGGMCSEETKQKLRKPKIRSS